MSDICYKNIFKKAVIDFSKLQLLGAGTMYMKSPIFRVFCILACKSNSNKMKNECFFNHLLLVLDWNDHQLYGHIVSITVNDNLKS